MTFRQWLALALILIGVYGQYLLPGSSLQPVTAATYVYEKSDTAIPRPVLSALSKLNTERGILATTVEQDVTNGAGEIPKQYRVAIPAAREAGLPALVVQAGDKVVRVVRDPKTAEQVEGSVQ